MKQRFSALPFCLCAALWYGLIWNFSAQSAAVSGGLSDGLLRRLLSALSPAFSAADAQVRTAAGALLSFFIRKGAHTFLYFVLAVLLWLTLRPLLPGSGRRGAAAMGLCVLLSGLDEYHQTKVPGRSGEVQDVLIDLTGAAAALVFLALLRWSARRRGAPPRRAAAILALLAGAAALGAPAWGPGVLFQPPLWAARRFLPGFDALTAAQQGLLLSSLAPILREILCLAGAAVLGLCVFCSAAAAGRFAVRSVLAGGLFTAAAAWVLTAPVPTVQTWAVTAAEGAWLCLQFLRAVTARALAPPPG